MTSPPLPLPFPSLQFMDSAACSMIDSHHGYDVVKIERMQRYGPDRGKKIKYDAPKCNETYNNVMGQVDRLDQLRASKKGFGTLELTRKRHKWTDKFADVLKDLGNTVALTLYNEAGDGVETPVSHPEFIIQVHEDWLNAESWYSAASGGRRRSAAPAPVPNTYVSDAPEAAAVKRARAARHVHPNLPAEDDEGGRLGDDSQRRRAVHRMQAARQREAPDNLGVQGLRPPLLSPPGEVLRALPQEARGRVVDAPCHAPQAEGGREGREGQPQEANRARRR